jgi:hypothetical protein
MTPGLVLMNSLLSGVIGCLWRFLIPTKFTIKMPHMGIDVTLTSWFTGPVFSSAAFSSGATTVCATGSRA